MADNDFTMNFFQKRTFLVRYFGKNTKRSKVQKSESFLTEKNPSTDCSISDATGNVFLFLLIFIISTFIKLSCVVDIFE